MGAVAVDLLSEKLERGWRAPVKREIEAQLVLRRSAGLADNAAQAPLTRQR